MSNVRRIAPHRRTYFVSSAGGLRAHERDRQREHVGQHRGHPVSIADSHRLQQVRGERSRSAPSTHIRITGHATDRIWRDRLRDEEVRLRAILERVRARA